MKTKNLILFAIFIASICKAQFCFTRSSNSPFSVNGVGAFLKSADFNGDGIKDIVTANWQSDDISLLLGTGTGSFSSGTIIFNVSSVGFISLSYSFEIADFDGDADVDIVVCDDVLDKLCLLKNNGMASFTPDVPISMPLFFSREMIAGDLDNNGSQDLVMITQQSGGGIAILLNPSNNGVFNAPVYYSRNTSTPTNSPDLLYTDLNNDGFKDLVTLNYVLGSYSASVFIHSGVGAVYNPAVVYTSSFSLKSLTAADFDGDSDIDIATASVDAAKISILFNSGNGTLGSPVSYTLNTSPSAKPNDIIHGDYDDDGDLDLAISDAGLGSTGASLSFFKNNGVGIFSAVSGYTVNSGPNSIISGDFDSNGKLDLALTSSNAGSDNIAVFLGGGVGVSLSASSTTICHGASVNITATSATTYTWNTSVTTNSILVSPTVTTSYSVAATNSLGCISNAVMTISVTTCTSLEDIASSVYPDFKLYPNPSNGIVTIETENELTLNVYNIIGELKHHKTINGNQTIDLSGLEKGIYFLTLIDNQNSEKTIKLILE
jgi:hypothetical protein